MAGPLQAVIEGEKGAKQKLKERRQDAVTQGYQRRSLSGIADQRRPKAAADSRRASTPNPSSAEASPGPRRSITPTPAPSSSSRASVSGITPRLEALSRPTTASQARQSLIADKRPSLSTTSATFAPPDRIAKEEPQDTGPQSAEFSWQNWNHFLHRSSCRAQDKEKYLELLRKKKEAKDMQACTFEPNAASRGRRSGPKQQASMFERAKEAEARKQQKMKQLRQELFDKEMAQCSFRPSRIAGTALDHRGPELGYQRSGADRQSLIHGPPLMRGSVLAGVPPDFSHIGAPAVQGMGTGFSNASAGPDHEDDNYDDSEGSELWDADVDDGSDFPDADEAVLSSGPRHSKLSERAIELKGSEMFFTAEEVPMFEDKSDAVGPGGLSTSDGGPSKAVQRREDRKSLLEATLAPEDVRGHTSDGKPLARVSGADGFAAALRRSFADRQSQANAPDLSSGNSAPSAGPRHFAAAPEARRLSEPREDVMDMGLRARSALAGVSSVPKPPAVAVDAVDSMENFFSNRADMDFHRDYDSGEDSAGGDDSDAEAPVLGGPRRSLQHSR